MGDFNFVVEPSPHLFDTENTAKTMYWVIGALAPITFGAIYLMGFPVVIVIIACIAGAVGTEAFLQWVSKKSITISDGSAIITGLLLALTLPPKITWWIPFIGGFIAIAIAKFIFGGLGYNVFNPALVARAMLMLSWPKEMTKSWFATISVDNVSQATPLYLLKQVRAGSLNLAHVNTLRLITKFIFANKAGVIGEASAILVLAGGLILLFRKIITWHVPVAFIGTVFVLDFIVHGDPIFYILAGGLILGAFFMATDYVTSPLTKKGKLIYGFGLGGVTVVLRFFSNLTEGVMFSILFMNSLAPLIDKYTHPRVFGEVKKK